MELTGAEALLICEDHRGPKGPLFHGGAKGLFFHSAHTL